jgi:hypothetical protein
MPGNVDALVAAPRRSPYALAYRWRARSSRRHCRFEIRFLRFNLCRRNRWQTATSARLLFAFVAEQSVRYPTYSLNFSRAVPGDRRRVSASGSECSGSTVRSRRAECAAETRGQPSSHQVERPGQNGGAGIGPRRILLQARLGRRRRARVFGFERIAARTWAMEGHDRILRGVARTAGKQAGERMPARPCAPATMAES